MKRHAFLVGAFVLLALVLVVAGVLTLNKSGWFTPRHQAVIYFDDSVKGLYIGAPVTFRGVKMGEVTRIGVEVNQQTLVARIFTFYYFAFFITMPIWTKIDKTKPVPERVPAHD